MTNAGSRCVPPLHRHPLPVAPSADRAYQAFKVQSYYGNSRSRKEQRRGLVTPDSFSVCLTSMQVFTAVGSVRSRAVLAKAHSLGENLTILQGLALLQAQDLALPGDGPPATWAQKPQQAPGADAVASPYSAKPARRGVGSGPLRGTAAHWSLKQPTAHQCVRPLGSAARDNALRISVAAGGRGIGREAAHARYRSSQTGTYRRPH